MNITPNNMQLIIIISILLAFIILCLFTISFFFIDFPLLDVLTAPVAGLMTYVTMMKYRRLGTSILITCALVLLVAGISTRLLYNGMNKDENELELVNVALESKGASVIEWPRDFVPTSLYLFGVRLPEILVNFKSDPATLLQPDSPGFFLFPGSKGTIVIDLSVEVFVAAFSLKRSTNSVLSQPREFTLQGSTNNVDWISFGPPFTFDLTGEDLQLYIAPVFSVRYLKMVVLSNWGDVDFTSLNSICVYNEQ